MYSSVQNHVLRGSAKFDANILNEPMLRYYF